MIHQLASEFVRETSLSAHESNADRSALLVQGGYYVATGIWPLLSMRSFERVTGPKTDKWLVKTVGVLVTAIGATLLLASKRKTPSPEISLLAAGSGFVLTIIDLTYVAKRRISPVYLLDAVAEVALLTALACRIRGRSNSQMRQ